MFYVNTCIRKVSAVPSVLVSLIPARLSPRLEQPLFRAENSHVARRCSDYCFFIDHDDSARNSGTLVLSPADRISRLSRPTVYLRISDIPDGIWTSFGWRNVENVDEYWKVFFTKYTDIFLKNLRSNTLSE